MALVCRNIRPLVILLRHPPGLPKKTFGERYLFASAGTLIGDGECPGTHMKQTVAILILLSNVYAQAPAAPGKRSVLIVLRQPEGEIGQRLATSPPSAQVPEEVSAAAERERAVMVKAQQESFRGRLAAAGVTGVEAYPELNMVRAEIPAAALSSVQSDPAVLAVTSLSEDAPSVGAAIGRPGHRPEGLQSPLLMAPATSPANGMAIGMPGVMPQTPFGGQPFMQQPMTGQPFMGQPGMPMGGGMGSGGMFQSLAGVVGSMGAQSSMMMPRASGFIVLAAGGAQIASILATNRKQACTIRLDAPPARAPAAGGQGYLMVRASPSCLWQAQSNAEWLHVDTDSPMPGTGLVRYTVAPSAGSARTGNITIAGITKTTIRGAAALTVSQGQ